MQLPDINLRVIRRLMKFLQAYHQEQQKVHQLPTERTVEDLSLVFGHILFRTWDSEQGSYEDRRIAQSLFRKLLIHYNRIFTSRDRAVPTMFSPLKGTTIDQSPKVRKGIPSVFASKRSSRMGISLEKDSPSSINLEKQDSLIDCSSPELEYMCGDVPSQVAAGKPM